MDIPDLVTDRLGDEEVTAGVSIGDGDAVCLTPTRTLVYRGDGLLSDEHVDVFGHDVEHLSVKEGRRKTKFVLEYVEGAETFTVPSSRGDAVLELLLQGVLRHDEVIGRRESIAGVYRFTELTLVVTDARLLKHIGNRVWDDDFEDYPFERVTGLDFERASNATSIAVGIDGRPQRVKVPNDAARIVRQTIEDALFAYYEVDSLEALNAAIEPPEPEPEPDGAVDSGGIGGSDDIGFEADIDPLVTGSDESGDEHSTAPEPRRDRTEGSAVPERIDLSPESSRDESEPEPGSDAESAGRARERPDERTETTAASGATPPADAESDARDDRSTASTPHRDESDGGDARTSSTGDRRAERTETADTGEGQSESVDGETADETTDAETDTAGGPGDSADDATPDPDETPVDESDERSRSAPSSVEESVGESVGESVDYEPASREDIAAVTERVDQLTEAVERQNELLKRQHRAIRQFVTELDSE